MTASGFATRLTLALVLVGLGALAIAYTLGIGAQADATTPIFIMASEPHRYQNDAVNEVNNYLLTKDPNCVGNITFEYGNEAWVAFVEVAC